MGKWLNAGLVASLFGAELLLGGPILAQTISPTPSIALKNGESLEIEQVYMIGALCRSVLVGTPEVEILEGPPGVSVAIKEAMITPRSYGCAKPVAGGKLVVSAKDVDEPSFTTITLRFKYKTREGDQMRSKVYKISLFP
jgi:hypothetical protein